MMKQALLLGLVGACTVGPHGVSPAIVGAAAPGAAPPAGGHIGCARDAGGTHFATAASLGAGVTPGCVDGTEVDVYADAGNRGAIARLFESIEAGTYYVQVEVFADAYGIADKPSTAFTKPYQIEVHLDGAKRRASHR